MSKTGVAVTLGDGNAGAIMGATTSAMKRAGVEKSIIDEYLKEAMSSDYNHLLQVTMEYVDVDLESSDEDEDEDDYYEDEDEDYCPDCGEEWDECTCGDED